MVDGLPTSGMGLFPVAAYSPQSTIGPGRGLLHKRTGPVSKADAFGVVEAGKGVNLFKIRGLQNWHSYYE
jgi:hypothetical protein